MRTHLHFCLSLIALLFLSSTIWTVRAAEPSEIGAKNRTLFAWCTGKPTPASTVDLHARDPMCAAILESLDHFGGNLRKWFAVDPNTLETRRELGPMTIQFLLSLEPLLCGSFNDRRAGKHLPKSECVTYDERIVGSWLDLPSLTPSLVKTAGFGYAHRSLSGATDPPAAAWENKKQREIVHSEILRHHPTGTSASELISSLTKIGFSCLREINLDYCTFRQTKIVYDEEKIKSPSFKEDQSGKLTNPAFPLDVTDYVWVVSFPSEPTGRIDNIIVDVEVGFFFVL